MRIDSPERPIQIDDAARIERRIQLRRLRYRLELRGRAVPGVDHRRHIVSGAQFVVINDAELFLVEGLAGVEQYRARARLARIRRKLRPREPEGILHARRLDDIRHQGQFRCVARGEAQLRIEVIALGAAVESVSIGLKMRRIHHVVDASRRRPRLSALQRCVLKLPYSTPASSAWPGFASSVKIAITPPDELPYRAEKGPRKHFDMVGGSQVELRKLSLPIGHRAGNAVRIQPQAPDSETRSRAESPDRQLQVLRVVLPALHRHSRHRDQRLREIHLQLAAVNGLLARRGRWTPASPGCDSATRVAVTTIVASSGPLSPQAAAQCEIPENTPTNDNAVDPRLFMNSLAICFLRPWRPSCAIERNTNPPHASPRYSLKYRRRLPIPTGGLNRNPIVKWPYAFNGLMSTAALLLPLTAATDSRVKSAAPGTSVSATAQREFQDHHPNGSLPAHGTVGAEQAAWKTVSIMSNSRNVTLNATIPDPSVRARGNVILSAAARKSITQNAAMHARRGRPTVRAVRAARAAGDLHRLDALTSCLRSAKPPAVRSPRRAAAPSVRTSAQKPRNIGSRRRNLSAHRPNCDLVQRATKAIP